MSVEAKKFEFDCGGEGCDKKVRVVVPAMFFDPDARRAGFMNLPRNPRMHAECKTCKTKYAVTVDTEKEEITKIEKF